ncbi:MAG: hypothetical protein ACO2PN_02590 [Pyrobaculum sp.]
MVWSRIVTRDGWAVLGPGYVATLWPPVPVPRAKMPVLVGRRGGRAVVTHVTLARDTLMPPKLIIKARDSTYEVQLVPLSEVYGVFNGEPHLAMLNCWAERCDLSPLYVVAYPAGVAEVAYGFVEVQREEGRWRPADRAAGPEALRVLGDPELARCFVRSRYAPVRCGESVEDALPLVEHFLPDRI